mmetsp:Transcript_43384/g.94471  ORF Transcript_43384/g.94471 Transcript_43384/m.94471 type:complete len:231 (-) Transcript_43384:2592-3284(-)
MREGRLGGPGQVPDDGPGGLALGRAVGRHERPTPLLVDRVALAARSDVRRKCRPLRSGEPDECAVVFRRTVGELPNLAPLHGPEVVALGPEEQGPIGIVSIPLRGVEMHAEKPGPNRGVARERGTLLVPDRQRVVALRRQGQLGTRRRHAEGARHLHLGTRRNSLRVAPAQTRRRRACKLPAFWDDAEPLHGVAQVRRDSSLCQPPGALLLLRRPRCGRARPALDVRTSR